MIKYEEEDKYSSHIYTEIERSAFNSYHAASYFLLNLDYKPCWNWNSLPERVKYDLEWWNNETGIEAEIHELLIVD